MHAPCINWFEYWFAHNNNLILTVPVYGYGYVYVYAVWWVVGVLFSLYIFLSSIHHFPTAVVVVVVLLSLSDFLSAYLSIRFSASLSIYLSIYRSFMYERYASALFPNVYVMNVWLIYSIPFSSTSIQCTHTHAKRTNRLPHSHLFFCVQFSRETASTLHWNELFYSSFDCWSIAIDWQANMSSNNNNEIKTKTTTLKYLLYLIHKNIIKNRKSIAWITQIYKYVYHNRLAQNTNREKFHN